jgi:hypothetical protein
VANPVVADVGDRVREADVFVVPWFEPIAPDHRRGCFFGSSPRGEKRARLGISPATLYPYIPTAQRANLPDGFRGAAVEAEAAS